MTIALLLGPGHLAFRCPDSRLGKADWNEASWYMFIKKNAFSISFPSPRSQISSGVYIASSIIHKKQSVLGFGFGSGTETNVVPLVQWLLGYVYENMVAGLLQNYTQLMHIFTKAIHNYIQGLTKT